MAPSWQNCFRRLLLQQWRENGSTGQSRTGHCQAKRTAINLPLHSRYGRIPGNILVNSLSGSSSPKGGGAWLWLEGRAVNRRVPIDFVVPAAHYPSFPPPEGIKRLMQVKGSTNTSLLSFPAFAGTSPLHHCSAFHVELVVAAAAAGVPLLTHAARLRRRPSKPRPSQESIIYDDS